MAAPTDGGDREVRQRRHQRRRRVWQDAVVLLSTLPIVALVTVERLT